MDYTYYDYSTTVGSTETLGIIAGLGVATFIISMIISVIMIISMWKIFKKAGKNGWEAIVPIYNIIVLLEICEMPVWQIVLYIIPFANIYITFKQYIELSKKFGKSTGFGVLTVFFPVICLPILAFGSSKYEKEQVSMEPSASILDVNEEGVPNNSEAKDFSYGYEKEETVIIPEINLDKEENKDTSLQVEKNAEVSNYQQATTEVEKLDGLEQSTTNSDSSDEIKTE